MKEIGKIVAAVLISVGIFAAFQVYYPKAVTTPVAVQTDNLPPVPPEPGVALTTIIDIDGQGRVNAGRLNEIAEATAQQMADANQFQHTNLRPYLRMHGAMRENIAYSTEPSWEAAYVMWRNSPPHDFNIKHGGKYFGYAAEKSATGTTFFVVIYAERP